MAGGLGEALGWAFGRAVPRETRKDSWAGGWSHGNFWAPGSQSEQCRPLLRVTQ